MNDGSGFGGDPFQFYYAYYLPNQAMLSMRNRPIDTLNQFTAARQYYAQTDRRSLYNPISATGDDTYDTLHPYAGQGKERMAQPFRFARDPSNPMAPVPRFITVGRQQFFPGLRVGRGPNANVVQRRSRRRGMGGMGGGMGGMGGGMGGMGGGMGGMGMGGMM